MTVGPFIRLWEPDSALRAFHAEAAEAIGVKKIGWALNKEGAAPLGAPFELVIKSFLKILCTLLAVLEIWRYAVLFLTVNVSFLYLITFCSFQSCFVSSTCYPNNALEIIQNRNNHYHTLSPLEVMTSMDDSLDRLPSASGQKECLIRSRSVIFIFFHKFGIHFSLC